jgi:hypothetical protein
MVGFRRVLLRGDPEEVSKTFRRKPVYQVFLFLSPPALQLTFASFSTRLGTAIFIVDKLNRSPLTRVLSPFA